MPSNSSSTNTSSCRHEFGFQNLESTTNLPSFRGSCSHFWLEVLAPAAQLLPFHGVASLVGQEAAKWGVTEGGLSDASASADFPAVFKK